MPFPFTTEHSSFPCSFLKAKSKWTPLAELHQAGKFKKLQSLRWPRFVRPNLHIPMAKLNFLRSWTLLIPECLFPRTVLLPGSFPAVQSGLWHVRKNIPLSSPLHSQSPVFLGKSCSVLRPRSHIFFQSLQNLPEITFTVAQFLPFRKAFPRVRESLVPWSWGRHFPHSKLPGLPGTNILFNYPWFWLVKTPRLQATMPRKQQHTQDMFSELLFTVKF